MCEDGVQCLEKHLETFLIFQHVVPLWCTNKQINDAQINEERGWFWGAGRAERGNLELWWIQGVSS